MQNSIKPTKECSQEDTIMEGPLRLIIMIGPMAMKKAVHDIQKMCT
jgi:hypothetical protein